MNLKVILYFIAAFAVSTPAAFGQSLERSGADFGKLGIGLDQSISQQSLEDLRRDGFELMADFRNSTRYAPIQNMVGLVHILRADGHEELCSGSLIAADKVLTNAHCVHAKGPNRAIRIVFNMHFLDPNRASDVRSYSARPRPLERNWDYDYAVIQLKQAVPGYTTGQFTTLAPRPREPLVLAGHPLGEPLYLSRFGCRFRQAGMVPKSWFAHGCSTLNGSSGSLIFSDDDLSVLIGLHSARAQ
ncbi:MAG: trypsin-like peptidase domain-containing protein [Rhodobacteraceae bacterium]|nr:trypsin-like peptidase domain-containing protein [Paracoccaceae bacterium]